MEMESDEDISSYVRGAFAQNTPIQGPASEIAQLENLADGSDPRTARARGSLPSAISA